MLSLCQSVLALLGSTSRVPVAVDSHNPGWTTREWLESTTVGVVVPVGDSVVNPTLYRRLRRDSVPMRQKTAGSRATVDIADAQQLLDTVYGPSTYTDRLMIGRRAQLGDDLVYRPGLIGSSQPVDTSLTYGEYDLEFFAQLIEATIDGLDRDVSRDVDRDIDLTFMDIGSGVGRLVLAAATLWPHRFSKCSGVEMVADLHTLASEAGRRAESQLTPRVKFVCADAAHALNRHFGELAGGADVVFAYSSTWPAEGDVLTEFSELCGTCLPVGTRIITTDRRLQLRAEDGSWRFDLLGHYEGRNAETGGTSIAYVQRVAKARTGACREDGRQAQRGRRFEQGGPPVWDHETRSVWRS